MTSFTPSGPLGIVIALFFASSSFSQITFQKTLGGSGNDVANYVINTNGGYLIAGYSSTGSSGAEDALLLKIGFDGDVLWQKRYGGSARDEFAEVIEADDGGYLAMGSTRSYGGGNQDIFLVKTDVNGNVEWQKTVGGPSNDIGRHILAVPNGYVISTVTQEFGHDEAFIFRIENDGTLLWSTVYRTPSFGTLFYANYFADDTLYASGAGNWAASYSRIDANNGTLLSTTLYDGSSTEALYYMVPTADGGFLLADHTWSASANNTLLQWVSKIDRDGNLLWSKVYPSGEFHRGRIASLSNGNILMIPTFFQSNNPINNPVLVKLDESGEVIWSYEYGSSTGVDRFVCGIEASDGGIIAVGNTSVAGNGGSDILMVKTDANGYIAGCCRTPKNYIAQTYQPTVFDFSFDRQPFYNPADVNASTGSNNLGLRDYCAPESLPGMSNVTLTLCPGSSVEINGTVYTAPGTVYDTIPGADCDSIVAYILQPVVNPVLESTVTFCPGDAVVINGVSYNAPGTVQLTIPSTTGGCDTLQIVHLMYEEQPTVTRTIEFCPGDTLTLGGINYTQPATVDLTLPAAAGCDTLATYILTYATLSGPTAVVNTCPADIQVKIPAGDSAMPVDFDLPQVQTDCPCPGISLEQTAGPASGSDFPVGATLVCFQAQDSCGNFAECCFTISVEEEADPCDIKQNGCVTFELLRITRDDKWRRTYYIRVTNSCPQPLVYTAFQLPNGVVAYQPAQNSDFIAPSGNVYRVRNPNYSPLYSIRYSTQGVGLQNGQSDLLRFTLPPHSAPDYINVMAKLSVQTYIEAHLNTFYCPVTYDPDPWPVPTQQRLQEEDLANGKVRLFPNPTDGTLFVDLSPWEGQMVVLRLFSPDRRQLLRQQSPGGSASQPVNLPDDLPKGVYWLDVLPELGKGVALQLVKY